MADLRLPALLQQQLCCPRCHHHPMQVGESTVVCGNPDCATVFPVIEGCPILINDDHSVFRVSDFVQRRRTTGQVQHPSVGPLPWRQRFKALLRGLIPGISLPVADFSHAQVAAELMARSGGSPRVLVIGAGDRSVADLGVGEIIYTDVDQGPLTHLICDAHDIPFAPGTFDAVLSDSVLEHVVDPARCVAEIHRVLRPSGLVYAVSPFMQQVHMGAYDFQRFTHLGHRRLFRAFDELASGVACGPGMALAWSFERFLASFAHTPRGYAMLRNLARLMIFPVKYFDRLIARRPGCYDNAAAYYFFGSRAETPLSDRDLIKGYRGLIR